MASSTLSTVRLVAGPGGGPPLFQTRMSIPLGRWGTPQEFGDVACFLASDRARYVNGTTVVVDGGLTRALF